MWYHIRSIPVTKSVHQVLWKDNWLVVEPPLWKIWKSIGMMNFPIYGKIKVMFQSPPTSYSYYHLYNNMKIIPDNEIAGTQGSKSPWPREGIPGGTANGWSCQDAAGFSLWEKHMQKTTCLAVEIDRTSWFTYWKCWIMLVVQRFTLIYWL